MLTATTPEAREPAPDPAPAFHYTVTATLEPSVLARVVELFVLRGLIPHRVLCRQVGADGLRVDLSVCGLEPDHAEHLAARMRQFPTVLGVLLRH